MKYMPVFLLLFSFPLLAFAQKDFELGFFTGFANYQGDLAENDVQFGETKIAIGGIIRYYPLSRLNLRASVYYGGISGDDKNSKSLGFRKYRFQSNLLEADLMVEWSFLGKNKYNEVGLFNPYLTPYVFSGIGYTFTDAVPECYHPECLNGITPFPEPGDRNTFISVPLGLGVKWHFYEYFLIGGEWGWRTVFSDYLDGVSAYGRREGLDWYFFTGATVSFYFPHSNDFNFKIKKKKKKKP